MRYLLAVLSIVLIMAGCDNDDMNKETNPYPDGVYPFEVSNVGHTKENAFGDGTIITWVNPTDSGFKKVHLKLFFGLEHPDWGSESLYSSDTGIHPDFDTTGKSGTEVYSDAVMGEDRFSLHCGLGNNLTAVIKCVDKFGNVSRGVEYPFNPHTD
jgi:hypothetical protein